jgi:hypothetical protein
MKTTTTTPIAAEVSTRGIDAMRFQSGPLSPIDSRGQRYVTFCHLGPKPEGALMLPTATEEEAWTLYWSTLSEYLSHIGAELVEWRTPPKCLEYVGEDFVPKFAIYSRLSVVERRSERWSVAREGA